IGLKAIRTRALFTVTSGQRSMIASIWAGPRGSRLALKIWRAIDSVAETIDSTIVTNRESRTIKIFRPK
ncbi:MAG: hypothetical protein ACREQR_09220, partial [Candidatus Binataceae bacterium]